MSQSGARSPGTGEGPGAAAACCADQSEIQAVVKAGKEQERSCTPAQPQFAAGRERKPNSTSPKLPSYAELRTPSCARQLEGLGSTILPHPIAGVAGILCSLCQEPLARDEPKSSFKIFQSWDWKKLICSKRGS